MQDIFENLQFFNWFLRSIMHSMVQNVSMRCDERKFTENECAKFKNYEIEFHKIYWTMENWCFV